MEKIIAISDIHGDVVRLTKIINFAKAYNLPVFCAGDISFSERGPIKAILELLNQVKTFFVGGNNERSEFIESLIKKYDFKNIEVIDLKVKKYKGKIIVGTGGCEAPYAGTPYEFDEVIREVELLDLFENYKVSHIDIFLAHSPPFGILDNLRGSKALRKIVDTFNIDIYICGHVHELAGSIEIYKETLFVNPGKIGALIDINNKQVDILSSL